MGPLGRLYGSVAITFLQQLPQGSLVCYVFRERIRRFRFDCEGWTDEPSSASEGGFPCAWVEGKSSSNGLGAAFVVVHSPLPCSRKHLAQGRPPASQPQNWMLEWRACIAIIAAARWAWVSSTSKQHSPRPVQCSLFPMKKTLLPSLRSSVFLHSAHISNSPYPVPG